MNKRRRGGEVRRPPCSEGLMRKRFLILFLRAVGTVAGSAAVCAVMPLRWMDATHRALGMGALPSAPVVEYLARSTSAFYALLGALLWAFSSDVPRYRPLIAGTGWAFVVFGALLAWIDAAAGLPWFWRAAEGPLDGLFGVVLLWMARVDEKV